MYKLYLSIYITIYLSISIKPLFGAYPSPKFPIPRGCSPEDKCPDSQRKACSVSHVPIPTGCPDSQRKRDTLFSRNLDTYPLGNILWESGIWEMRYNPLFIYFLYCSYEWFILVFISSIFFKLFFFFFPSFPHFHFPNSIGIQS